MFERVLIANRGEIAVRIARTLRRLGIEAVAVHSDADAAAPHVRAADRSLRIGPAAAAESYLSVERLVEAALRCGAEAVHPGYGFLSEWPQFARACRDAGLAFVGPGPEAIALLGDKVAAKRAARQARVPVLPGLDGEESNDEEIAAWAERHGTPLILKAAAGGGGRGMRLVRELAELPAAIAAARHEAGAAFGDERLFAERYVERSRHVEVQVIADAHGAAIHLGERECSLQRRHQKVIEESPSPVVDAELRRRMGESAVALARSCGYLNAGTVELIAERDDPGCFYFLEMNTRLQVEHPVTEAVTGFDLVELQLRVAAGEPLGIVQEEIEPRGHAIEARVYAEDPASGFLPSSGRVVAYREPAGARVDSGVAAGTEVGTEYDPLLAKLIVHEPERGAALAALDRALGELVLLGPATNAAYLQALLARPEVRAGDLDTGLIERLGAAVAPPPPDPALPAVALALLLAPRSADPWQLADGFSPSGPLWATARLAGSSPDAAPAEVAVRPEPDAREPRRGGGGRPAGRWRWRAGGAEGSFALDGELLSSSGVTRLLDVHRDGEAVWLRDGRAAPVRFAFAGEERQPGALAAAGSLAAPMPGTVIAVEVEPGAAVEAGAPLVVLESMKMELTIASPVRGVVSELRAEPGRRVARGELLVAVSAAEDAA